MWVHRLLELDADTRTGICEHCGPVDVRWHKRWVCATKSREDNRKYRQSGKYKSPHHGLTRSERESFIAGKLCAICGGTSRLVVDHDHQTNRIRGVLCTKCNVSLGNFGDDLAGLMRAVAYLEASAILGAMPFIVIKPDGTQSSHKNYDPAESEARETPYAVVVYQGIRGQEVKVWPL